MTNLGSCFNCNRRNRQLVGNTITAYCIECNVRYVKFQHALTAIFDNAKGAARMFHTIPVTW